jgi:hypothetical protein
MERLFLAVVLPSATYGLKNVIPYLTDSDLDYLSEVQGRLVKIWMGVSKFSSTRKLVRAVGWQDAASLFRDGTIYQGMTNGNVHPLVLSAHGKDRRVIAMFLSNGFHELWCSAEKCYKIKNYCICRLCNTNTLTDDHILKCSWIKGIFDTTNLINLQKFLRTIPRVN